MGFFARPNLEDLTFKQLPNSIITLSGQTRIATVSGLTLTNGAGGFIPIIATGATDGDVLTYSNGKITLIEGGSSSGIYYGASPTTCTVGGLPKGSVIGDTSIESILQRILVPTVNPTITEPSSVFTISPNNTVYEVGSVVNIEGTVTFNRGCINPAYCGGPDKRSGAACYYDYSSWGAAMICIEPDPSTLVHTYEFTPSHSITQGANLLKSRVEYKCGHQPYNSTGGTYLNPLPSGCTCINIITISGIYPYYYGKYSSNNAPAGQGRPIPTAELITGGTKVVASSQNTLCINFNSTYDDYLWFAVPATGGSAKTKWYISQLNCGDIGGSVGVGGNLFPEYNWVANVRNECWTNQQYMLFISNYQTASTTIMELRNS